MIAGPTAILAQNLGRVFEDASGRVTCALQGVNLEIATGEFIVVRGPSGCGKSTLLNLLGLLDHATTGQLWIEGVEVGRVRPSDVARFRRRHLGFLFQDAGLIEPMTALGAVELPLAYRDVARAERTSRAISALAQVGLGAALEAQVADLSGGERLRVGLARALVTDPSILICDEPTAALDEKNSVAVVDMLKAHAAHGRVVICASHDPLVIARATRAIALDRGRIRLAEVAA
ncbi:MAG: ATP-binding cassette domain-containing protein [Caulobacteraceae bacterium]|nr:ATP-binding cassette domain-containing protein [Caulobacteraceae bacterium]